MLPDTGVPNLRLAGATLCPVQAERHSIVSKDWENEPSGWGEFETQPILTMKVSHHFIRLAREGVAEDLGSGSSTQEVKHSAP